ncbi:acetyl-CoA carboxylase biotin carboxyl carrier protein subunit [Leptospira sarikeiensis]|uniref:Acetyl-CoA carboxylase biotin carboxyl carrier protein subunit n=1 Tax=Leptospira sarikeiensis TaxID=2484943 RepID=A0A4R9KFQ7_9LEPT|nr:acetyl-CoA carboxylase biotin carboxyl carrier protein subunit [Leptospira sarikeiensis]TGL64113.1 acetyl-CoA carboxylase biotin carboxyl carrier protein subunit [Leptospira sarikeiensis]
MNRLFRLRWKEREYVLDLGEFSSRLLGPEKNWESLLAHYSWNPEKDGSYSLPDGSIALLRSGKLFIHTKGKTFQFSIKGKESSDSSSVGLDIKSPMPGKIIKMEVKPGDTVRKGQTLAVVEAMKMEHALKAGLDAEVKEVISNAGDIVAQDQILIRLG